MKIMLFMKDLYTNKNIDMLTNSVIYEYDMVDAGYSLVKEYKQLPSKIIKELGEMNKTNRKIAIGLRMRKDKDFNRTHTHSFSLARESFVIANKLEDDDILSIKKDAIFIIGKKCKSLKFGEIEFKMKNSYSSFYNINGIEFYYDYNSGNIDIKGIGDQKLDKHDKYMMDFFRNVFRRNESKSASLVTYMKTFVDDYKKRKLPLGYYRNLDSNNSFLVEIEDNDLSFLLDGITPDLLKNVNINFNFTKFIMPLMAKLYYTKI